MPREKHHQISDNVASISNGLEEVTVSVSYSLLSVFMVDVRFFQMMMSIMSHLNNLEAEKQKYQVDSKTFIEALHFWRRPTGF